MHEKDNESLDDYFYPLDFEKQSKHVVDLEEILKGAYGNTNRFASA